MKMKTRYFHDKKVHNLKSPDKIVPLLCELFSPTSVVDFGCGLGTWLKSFQDNGIRTLLGLDGEWLDKSKFEKDVLKMLQIVDLEQSIKLDLKYDLAISLEVAEHLSPAAAQLFVKNLTAAADTIVFSAAIPFQGGQNHINEKPLSFWIKLFQEQGFYFYDVIRGRIWNDDQVFWWYKQNMVVFSSKNLNIDYVNPIDIVHPELLSQYYHSKYNLRRIIRK